MVSLYFGLPGCGKTTLLTAFAYRAVRSKKYKHVYCNIDLNIEGVERIVNSDVGRYLLRDCLVLIDEATLFAFSRNYKTIEFSLIDYMVKHRHFMADVFFFSQSWDSLDKVIRTITDRVFYVYKGKLKRWMTYFVRIPYSVMFPDKKDSGSKLGEIVQGYAKPGLISRLLKGRLRRRKYYKYFDSFSTYDLPLLPKRSLKEVYRLEHGSDVYEPYLVPVELDPGSLMKSK